MNKLDAAKRSQVIAALVEGTSINAACRITGVAKHTVLNLLRDLGCAAAKYHHHKVRGLHVKRLQCDEIWCFVGAKRKNVSIEKEAQGWGANVHAAFSKKLENHGHAIAPYLMHYKFLPRSQNAAGYPGDAGRNCRS
jgi:hypothetical protein